MAVLEPHHPAARPQHAGGPGGQRGDRHDEPGDASPLQHDGRAVGGGEAQDDVGLFEVPEAQPEVGEQHDEGGQRHRGPEPQPCRQAREEHLLVAGFHEPEPIGVVAGGGRPHEAERHDQSDDGELNPALTSHGVCPPGKTTIG